MTAMRRTSVPDEHAAGCQHDGPVDHGAVPSSRPNTSASAFMISPTPHRARAASISTGISRERLSWVRLLMLLKLLELLLEAGQFCLGGVGAAFLFLGAAFLFLG